MELEELKGSHILTGVEVGYKSFLDEYGNEYEGNYIAFVLDGETYFVREDNNDGYRSAARDIIIDNNLTVNTLLPEIKVLCIMMPDNGEENDVIQLYDINSGEIILSAGTESTNEWYPCFIAEWKPENMYINK